MEPGQIVGEKYKILRELGRGAMGAVFEVEHVFIKKRFALKSINPELAKNPEFRARALRESQASAAIRHPNIVDVSDFGETKDGAPYIVMEFLDGRPLTDVIEEQAPMSGLRALRIAVEILEGLEAAHKAGIVHRDIKPDNIFVLSDSLPDSPHIKIVDFGISKMRTTEEGMTLTRTNAVMGTPYYMSLEQCRGAKDVDGRADLFSVGVILFELLSRRIPFEADTFAELVVKMVKGERTPVAEAAPWVPAPLAALVEKATAVERTERFADASAMLAEIHRLMETLPNLDAPPGQSSNGEPKGGVPVSGTEATTFDVPQGKHVTSSEPAAEGSPQDAAEDRWKDFRRDEVTEQVEVPAFDDGNSSALSRSNRPWLWPVLGLGITVSALVGYFLLRGDHSRRDAQVASEETSISSSHDAGAKTSVDPDAAGAHGIIEDASNARDAALSPTTPDADTGRPGTSRQTKPRPRSSARPSRPARRRSRNRTRHRTRHRTPTRFRLKTND